MDKAEILTLGNGSSRNPTATMTIKTIMAERIPAIYKFNQNYILLCVHNT